MHKQLLSILLGVVMAAVIVAPSEVVGAAEAEPVERTAAKAQSLSEISFGEDLLPIVDLRGERADLPQAFPEFGDSDVFTLYERSLGADAKAVWIELSSAAEAERTVSIELVKGKPVPLRFVAPGSIGFPDNFLVAFTEQEVVVYFFETPTGFSGSLALGASNWRIEADAERIRVVQVLDLTEFHGDVPEDGRPPSGVPTEPPPLTDRDGRPLPTELGKPLELESTVPTKDWAVPEEVTKALEAPPEKTLLPVPLPDSDEPTGQPGVKFLQSGIYDVVDVAVLGDANATVSITGVEVMANNMIGQTNATYVNSNVPARVRLVGVQTTPHTATTPRTSDIVMAEVQDVNTPIGNATRNLRNRTQADIVVTIVGFNGISGDVSGRAGGVSGPEAPNYGYGYVVAETNINNSTVGWAHEISHILGGAHEGQNNDGESYAKARITPTFRTVMASVWVLDGSSIQFLTDDTETFGTNPLGNAVFDNSRAVTKWGDNVGDLLVGHYCPDHDVAGYPKWASENFENTIGRTGNSSEIIYYRDRLANGHDGSTLYSTADAFLEMRQNAGKVDTAARIYRAVLGRVPDYGGHDYWTGILHAGHQPHIVATYLQYSGEGTALHGWRTNEQFVQYVYQAAFNRPADPGGLNYWTWWVNTVEADPAYNREQARGHFAAYFADYVESLNFNPAKIDTIGYYFGIWRQSPDSNLTVLSNVNDPIVRALYFYEHSNYQNKCWTRRTNSSSRAAHCHRMYQHQ